MAATFRALRFIAVRSRAVLDGLWEPQRRPLAALSISAAAFMAVFICVVHCASMSYI
jgi:hypothetical protein